MPRKPKPFSVGNNWYTDMGGRRTLLARGIENFAKARTKLDELLEARKKVRQSRASDPDVGLKVLIDRFAEECLAIRPASTQGYYRWCLRRLAQAFGNCKAMQIGRPETKNWKRRLLTDGYGPCTVNHLVRSGRRLYNWAIEEEILPGGCNPFQGLTAEKEPIRKRLVTTQEHQALCKHADSQELLDVLTAMRYTPARPVDLRRLEWGMVDWTRKLWVLPEHKTRRTSSTGLPRVIAFPAEVEAMLARRSSTRRIGETFVFLSPRRRPWKKWAMEWHFQRARRQAGIGPDTNGEELTLYSYRHTILTLAVRAGVTGPQLQVLGGWTSLTMAKRYVHLAESDVYRIGMIAAEAVASQEGKEDEVAPSIGEGGGVGPVRGDDGRPHPNVPDTDGRDAPADA